MPELCLLLIATLTIKAKDFYEMPIKRDNETINWDQPFEGGPVRMGLDSAVGEDLLVITISRDSKTTHIVHAKDATYEELKHAADWLKKALASWFPE